MRIFCGYSKLAEALKMELTQPDLLLLDVMMGEISGFKGNGEHAEKNGFTASIPIIFITAKDTENDTVTGFNLGADDYISKPFSLREVIARVHCPSTYQSHTGKRSAGTIAIQRAFSRHRQEEDRFIDGINFPEKKNSKSCCCCYKTRLRVFSAKIFWLKVWQRKS